MTMNNNFNKLLSKANLLFKSGKYQSAIDVYLKLLSFNNNCFELYFNLSLSYFNVKDIDNSIKYAISAINLKDNDISLAKHMYNLCTLKPEDMNLLVKFQALVDKINDIDLCFKCSYLLKKKNEINNSLYFLQKILEIDNNNLKALKEVATIYSSIDKEVAIQMCEELFKDYPNDKDILDLALTLYYKVQNYEKCAEVARKLLKNEKNAYYYTLLANSLMYQRKYKEGEEVLDEALSIFPENEPIRILLIDACSINRHKDKAYSLIEDYKIMDKFQPSYAKLRLADREIDDVRDEYFKLSTQFITDEKILDNAKKIYYRLNIKDRFNISESEFLNNRKKSSKFGTELQAKISDKLIINEDCTGKKLLIIAMNGAGDLIMSSRYLNILNEKNIQATFLMKKSLSGLIKYNFPFVNIITFDNNFDNIDDIEFDCVSSDLNLINVLNMNLKEIPFSSGYIKVEEKVVKEKSNLFNFKNDKLKIGLYWQGNPALLTNRSIKLSQFLPLFENNNRQFYSFQISKDDYESEQLKSSLNLIDLAPHISNYEDTAAFLMNIDVLVTIDTSIAHLAGALGVRTFLLLPYDTEWRWFDDTETTPWYDSVRIFKQGPDAKWEPVIKRINDELNNAKL